MKNYINYILIALLLGTTACTREDYLDFLPKGTVIPSTIEDYRLLLDHVDKDTRPRGVTEGFNEKHTITNFINDNQIMTVETANFIFRDQSETRAYLFEAPLFSSLENDPNWDIYYAQIYNANVVLDGLQTVTDGTVEEIAALEAEAKLHRAYAYFNLVNLYGVHYNPATADTDLGVPIREGILFEGDLTRASVQQVYDLMLSDINESLPHLPDAQPSNLTFRPSKAAAYGFLAKIYLYQGNYQQSLEAVNTALSFSSTLRDLNNDPISTRVSYARSLPIHTDNVEIVWYKNFLRANSVASPELLSLYEPDDVRSQWYALYSDAYFESNDIDEYVIIMPFDNGGEYPNGINTPDLYLIRAECNARLGNIADANTDLNTLREKRFITGTFTPLNITDPAALLSFVKEEQRREMGNYLERTFDIKRFNRFDGDNISLTHTFNGVTATLEANSLNWVLPIAPKYVQQNPEIEQNPRD